MDSIDPLVRLNLFTDYLSTDFQSALKQALSATLHNLNGDGVWVFRRHGKLTYGYSSEMYSTYNESNLFFT